jgi:hypothetical protein
MKMNTSIRKISLLNESVPERYNDSNITIICNIVHMATQWPSELFSNKILRQFFVQYTNITLNLPYTHTQL